MSGIHLHHHQQQQQQNEKEVKVNKAAASSSSSTAAAAADEGVVIIKCPRCDSPNTKFCYYNNYSLSQPRHFCKTCRRYWTKGGALRNVPVGGGCRKSKKLKSSSSYSSSSSASAAAGATSSSSSDISGFKFFSPPPTNNTMDFNVKGLSLMSPPGPSTYNSHHHNNHPFGMDLSVSSLEPPYGMGGSMNVNTSLASSIESLSCMNQDLHWKLQQQRLGLMLKEDGTAGGVVEAEKAPLQPILFRELNINNTSRQQQQHHQQGRAGAGGGDHHETEWFFGNSSYVQQVTSAAAADHHQAAAAPSNNNKSVNTNANDEIQQQHHQIETNWNVKGQQQQVHAWGDLHPYNH